MKLYIVFLCLVNLAFVGGAVFMAYWFNDPKLLWWWVVPAVSICFTSFSEKTSSKSDRKKGKKDTDEEKKIDGID